MPPPAQPEQITPLARREAEATLRRLRDKAAQRADGLSDPEKDALADEAAREVKDGLNARLGGQPKD